MSSTLLQVNAVVVGFDYDFSYMKLIKACSYLRNPRCHFVATNEDATLPNKSDIVFPGWLIYAKQNMVDT